MKNSRSLALLLTRSQQDQRLRSALSCFILCSPLFFTPD
ncbi:hypothetical protein OUM_1195 [Helicobacter pylori R038b]|uniref:Uncharacterized protein n=1 Tax=Helicobacter pylori R038b TaxID=1145115 RepID=K2KPJ4_HELPX|nr:hypothetical protein OUM_1195 [Helicobacter pylori R038b]